MATRSELERDLHTTLSVDRFNDYGPNGIQVEGREQVQRLVSGVTASRALIEAAIDWGCDAIVVHHGLFWRGHDGRLTGWLAQRVRLLMQHDINLFAYHLPLDAHPTLGNNAQLGQRLGLRAEGLFGDQDLGHWATAAATEPLSAWQDQVQRVVQRETTVVPGDGRPLRRIAWCTGGAQSNFEAAIKAGADLYITGEISEPQAHLARETGVAFMAAGHHATECFGAPALGEHLAQRFGLVHQFIHVPNPA